MDWGASTAQSHRIQNQQCERDLAAVDPFAGFLVLARDHAGFGGDDEMFAETAANFFDGGGPNVLHFRLGGENVFDPRPILFEIESSLRLGKHGLRDIVVGARFDQFARGADILRGQSADPFPLVLCRAIGGLGGFKSCAGGLDIFRAGARSQFGVGLAGLLKFGGGAFQRDRVLFVVQREKARAFLDRIAFFHPKARGFFPRRPG